MGLPVTVFRHTDVGAPIVLPTKPSDWLVILKACLVDGYGSKAGLGWTLEFGDVASLKMVFKNNLTDGGSGGAVQVQSHGGTDNLGEYVRFTPAKAISAIDVFSQPCGYRGIKTSNNGNYVNGWTIVGCGRAFFIKQEYSLTTYNTQITEFYSYGAQLWIGDIQSTVPNDQNIFTMVSGGYNRSASANSLTTGGEVQMGYNSPPSLQLYDINNAGISTAYNVSTVDSITDTSSAYNADPAVNNVPIMFSPAMVLRNAPNSTDLPANRGVIAGIFAFSYKGFWGASFPIVRTMGANTYEMLAGRSIPSYAVLLSGEWYD
jgi:hypothetical protein